MQHSTCKVIHVYCVSLLLLKNQQNLFFIIGIGRSGTTIFQELLNTFSNFCNLTESYITESETYSLWTPVRQNNDFTSLVEYIQKNWTKDFFVEKTPDSILCLEQLLENFSNANYIFLERNPRDIVLSQLNLFSQTGHDVFERRWHIKNLIMKDDDMVLNREQYWSKLTLIQIQNQIKFKNLFKNKITLRYEDIHTNFKSILLTLEKTFNIKSNFDAAQKILNRPSASSKNNKYKISQLNDNQAILMVRIAQKLWNYYND